MTPAFQILSILLSAAATLLGGLVLYNFRMLTKRLDIQDKKISAIEAEQKKLAARKELCLREFVPTDVFVREIGYTRRRLDAAVEGVERLSAKFDSLNQLPQLAGQVASQTVKEIFKHINLKESANVG